MSRHDLEQFLASFDLWSADRPCFFSPGFLNRVYFYIDEVVFGGTGHEIPIKVGVAHRKYDFDGLSTIYPRSRQQASTQQGSLLSAAPGHYLFASSADGTAHDDPEIRHREAYAFEAIYDPPPATWNDGVWAKMRQWRREVWIHTKTFLGLVPTVHRRTAPGVYFALRSRGDQYVEARTSGHRALETHCTSTKL